MISSISKCRIELLAILFQIVFSSCDNATTSVHGIMGQRKETVYVCTGPASRCYHKTSRCKWLERCSDRVEAVTVIEAIKFGKRPCKYCYGQ